MESGLGERALVTCGHWDEEGSYEKTSGKSTVKVEMKSILAVGDCLLGRLLTVRDCREGLGDREAGRVLMDEDRFLQR